MTQTTATTFTPLSKIIGTITLPTPSTKPAKPSTDSSKTSDCDHCRGLNYCRYASHAGFREVVDDGTTALAECRYHLDFRARRRLDTLFDDSCVPPRYRDASFTSLDRHPGNIAAITALVKAVGTNHSLYLVGDTGTGKTLLVSAFANTLTLHSRSVLYITAPELLMNLNYNLGEYQTNVHHYQRVPTLIIDDLGVERANQYNGEQLAIVLEGRRRGGLQTVLTSEASTAEVGEAYRAVGSRRPGQLLSGVEEVRLKNGRVDRI